MPERLLELRQAISLYISKHPTVTPAPLPAPQQVAGTLLRRLNLPATFEVMTRELLKVDTCASFILPFVQSALKGMPDDRVGTMREMLMDTLATRFLSAEDWPAITAASSSGSMVQVTILHQVNNPQGSYGSSAQGGLPE